MIRFQAKSIAVTTLLAGGAFLLFTHLAAGQPGPEGSPRTASLTPAPIPYIDAHTHIYQVDPEGAVALILAAQAKLNGTKYFIQTEPYGPGTPGHWDAELILPAVKKHPDKLAVLGGGGTLNPMIIEAYNTGNAGPDVQKKFRERAEELIRAGVVGFGELSIEHFSLPQSPVKDYEYAPADSPLMLLDRKSTRLNSSHTV